jgi:hypothetical protein
VLPATVQKEAREISVYDTVQCRRAFTRPLLVHGDAVAANDLYVDFLRRRASKGRAVPSRKDDHVHGIQLLARNDRSGSHAAESLSIGIDRRHVGAVERVEVFVVGGEGRALAPRWISCLLLVALPLRRGLQ